MANRKGVGENSDRFFFLGSKTTIDGDCSHLIKRWLLLDWGATGKLENPLECKDIILPIKVHVVFPVLMYRCESWHIKKAEHQRIDVFKLQCWRRFLRVPWTAMRSHKSFLKGINPEYSLEELMLKLQYFGHLILTADSLEKTLKLGKVKDRRREYQGDEIVWWHHQFNNHEFGQTSGDDEGQRRLS